MKWIMKASEKLRQFVKVHFSFRSKQISRNGTTYECPNKFPPKTEWLGIVKNWTALVFRWIRNIDFKVGTFKVEF